MTEPLLPAFLIRMRSFWAKVRAMSSAGAERQVELLARDVRRGLAAGREGSSG